MKPTIHSVLAGTFTAIALLATPVASADTIYKWVDENGVTQYGSRPPRGQEDRAKLIKGKSFSQSRRPGSELYVDEEGGAEAGDDAEADTDTDEEATEDEAEADIGLEADAGADVETTGDEQAAAAPTGDDPISKQEREQAELEAKIKTHNCQKAQQTLKVLKENARVQVKEGDKMVFLTDAQVAERKKQAEQVAADNCS